MAKQSKIVWFAGILATAGLLFSFFVFGHKPKPDLTVIGPVKMADGIGRQSVELIEALYGALRINYIPTNKLYLADVPEHIASLIKKSDKQLGRVILYEESLPSPNQKFYKRLNQFLGGPKREDQIRIAYSVIESSAIPPLWAEGLNTYFDAVALPDPSLVEVYQSSGVEIPIFVLPLGLNIDPFLEQPLKSKRNDPFCFLNVSSMIPRKNHVGLIQAFYKAFGDNPNVILLLNYRKASAETLAQVSHLIEALQVHNIYLQSEHLDKAHYLQFLLRADVLVSLAKGEGFSIQPREAMALGMPIIISNNTAHTTIIRSGLACAIPCPTSEAAYNPYLKCVCGEEYLADLDAAAAALRTLYENYEKYLEHARERREWASLYRFEHLKPLYLNLIKPSKIFLGERNEITQEGLTTSSADLYHKYQKLASNICLLLLPCFIREVLEPH
jgi:glycosyltransferase involved in cell wall biosynthesis